MNDLSEVIKAERERAISLLGGEPSQAWCKSALCDLLCALLAARAAGMRDAAEIVTKEFGWVSPPRRIKEEAAALEAAAKEAPRG